MKIPITKPCFGEEERQALVRPLDSGWVVQGPEVARFEQKFSTFTGARHSIATSSCTTALHVAVAALGLQPGDEVIVPAFTWVATANVVEYMGATPVFCDIDLSTFNIDVTKIDALVTSKTVGIIPVHLFGLAVDMDAVLDVAKRRGLWVVEDAACGFAAWYRGRHVGTFGDAGCFSFHPRKSITTGEGGMITTERDDLDTASRTLRDHGASRSDLSRHEGAAGYLLSDYAVLGYNYRMTDMQGALGCAQLDRASSLVAARVERARRYDERLADCPWLVRPAVPDGCVHGYQSYVTVFAPEPPSMANVDALHERRNRLMASLEAKGIATRQGSHAAVLQTLYVKKYSIRRHQFPNATLADRVSLSLPLYPQMTDAEQDSVVSSLIEARP
jgi:dTDP-4-amino-4,6-dideoxygalactose transaminase